MSKSLGTEDKLEMSLDSIIAAERKSGNSPSGKTRGSKRYSNRSEKPYSPSSKPRSQNRRSSNGNGNSSSESGARVYVGNLSWNTSWQDLKDHMRKAGTVVRSDVLLEDDGRSKGCGIVEYSTSDEARTAIETLTDTKINGTDRAIFVREDRETKGGRSTRPEGRRPSEGRPEGRRSNSSSSSNEGSGRQVYVGNLPYDADWKELKDKFKRAGNVVRADILQEDGRSKGSGTVLFETSQEARKAISMFDEKDFRGRAMSVHLDKFA